ncbi:hypothetical protein ACIRYZ_19100 [Kitasatospora sp. NPDC101155]|uniref:hypothetical protein n=1 Tax=Kitasatospora sp. NPDC101155 TaxID=3364097 RepID=UPI0037F2587E
MTTTTTEEELQRPPAEVRYAEELAALRAEDRDHRPPGWELSLRAARRFIVGDETAGIARKFVGDPALVEQPTSGTRCLPMSTARTPGALAAAPTSTRIPRAARTARTGWQQRVASGVGEGAMAVAFIHR